LGSVLYYQVLLPGEHWTVTHPSNFITAVLLLLLALLTARWCFHCCMESVPKFSRDLHEAAAASAQAAHDDARLSGLTVGAAKWLSAQMWRHAARQYVYDAVFAHLASCARGSVKDSIDDALLHVSTSVAAGVQALDRWRTRMQRWMERQSTNLATETQRTAGWKLEDGKQLWQRVADDDNDGDLVASQAGRSSADDCSHPAASSVSSTNNGGAEPVARFSARLPAPVAPRFSARLPPPDRLHRAIGGAAYELVGRPPRNDLVQQSRPSIVEQMAATKIQEAARVHALNRRAEAEVAAGVLELITVFEDDLEDDSARDAPDAAAGRRLDGSTGWNSGAHTAAEDNIALSA
jgi:hypothetical protein